MISFIDGFCTNQRNLTDEMYSDASMHDEDGDWQMIFGLNTLPDYQRKGYAAKIMCAMIDLGRQENRKGLVLTCKDRLVPYYSNLDLKMRVYPQVFMVVLCGIRCDWSFKDEYNKYGKEISKEKSETSCKRRVETDDSYAKKCIE